MDTWIRSYAAELGAAVTRRTRVRWAPAPSGARLAFVGGAVAKFHHARTRADTLAAQLLAVAGPALRSLFVPPLAPDVATAPDGSLVTVWPEVPVLEMEDDIPWQAAGRLLARLHGQPPPAGLPLQPVTTRLSRAMERACALPDDADRELLLGLGERLLREAEQATSEHEQAQRHTAESAEPQAISAVHGDFHLGQLGWWEGDWRLLDIDDLGSGDPAWDLARPAGFWAAGLLGDDDWADFLDAYRGVGGHAVPAVGDPWPPLDLPARCAVVVAAVQVLSRPVHSDFTPGALLSACRQM